MTPEHGRDVSDPEAGRPFVVAVASGKGGTGKTLISTNLAVWAATGGQDVVLVDCDADAPNDHLFLTRAEEVTTVVEATVAEVDPATCTACGACRDVCAFGAVRVLGGSALVFEELCHGCGLCLRACPSGAIHMPGRRVGIVAEGVIEHRAGVRLVSGVLDIGQVKAPDVIRAAVAAGMRSGTQLAILDAPPGAACPVVAAVGSADALLLVTEPTPFGLHDLELALELGDGLGVPMAIVVNKAAGAIGDVQRAAAVRNVPVVSSVPFERRIAEAYATGNLILCERGASEWLDPILAWIEGVSSRVREREVVYP